MKKCCGRCGKQMYYLTKSGGRGTKLVCRKCLKKSQASRIGVDAKKSAWITDWAFIVAKEKYIVCPINQNAEKEFYLGQPSIMLGWQVTRLMEKCYAALPMPKFKFEK